MRGNLLIKAAMALAVAYLLIAYVAQPHSKQEAYEDAYRKCMKHQTGYNVGEWPSLENYCRSNAESARDTYR